jgi:hypothetical protein
MPFQMHTLGFFYGLPRLNRGNLQALNNMKQKIFAFLFIVLMAVTLYCPKDVFAKDKASSAKIETKLASNASDYRVDVLRGYLQQYDSPLVDNAEDFIRYADLYNLDWRFVAAISGLESTFGKQIPDNSYNGWGYGIYGTNVRYFNSWEDGIKTVSKDLREKYMNTWGANDVYAIGKIYAASPTWAVRVEYFMNRIQDYSLKSPESALPLTI